MGKKEKHFFVRSKVWLVDGEDQMVFGPGRLRILEAVKEHGSLFAAAKSLKMSYRGLWDRMRASENRLGAPLFFRGPSGSSLTPLAESLAEGFSRLQKVTEKESDRFFSAEAELLKSLAGPGPRKNIHRKNKVQRPDKNKGGT
jgi:molybdate transport system regulatory protein